MWRQLRINLVHDIDLLRNVLSDIDAITGFAGSTIRPFHQVEAGGVLGGCSSCTTGSISVADTTPSHGGNPDIAANRQELWWISGTKGSISFPSMILWIGSADWLVAPNNEILWAEKISPLDTRLCHFIDVMKGDPDPLIPIPDADESLRTTSEIETHLSSQIRF